MKREVVILWVCNCYCFVVFFFVKQKTAYEMRMSDWSSDVCSSDLCAANSGMEWRGAQLNGCQFTHGMVHCVVCTGVRLRTLLDEAGVKPSGKWLLEIGRASCRARVCQYV